MNKQHKSYKVKYGINQWRVYHYDQSVNCYRESATLQYCQAVQAVKEANYN